jgi:Na+-driven multidrug efflux pump
LIFGLFNLGGLGILGAGITTTISRIIGVILLFRKINQKEIKIHIQLVSGKLIKTFLNLFQRLAYQQLLKG